MAWLTGWYRRKPKIIIGSIAGGQTNYQLKLTIYKGSGTDTDNTIYLGGYVNNDFSDLRFTSSDETTLLPYWIEGYISGVSTIVWIKIDSIPADPFTKTVYIYYDNPIASPTSSGTNTFSFFDHFEGSTVDGKWTWSTPGTIYGYGSVVVSNSIVELTGGLNTWWALKAINAPKTSTPFVIGYYAKISESTSNHQNILGASNFTGDFWGYDMAYIGSVGTPGNIYGSRNNGTTSEELRTTTLEPWTKIEVVVKSGSVDFYENDVLTYTKTTNVPDEPMGAWMGVAQTIGKIWADYVFIRKYSSPEPIWDGTSPEQTYTANLTVSSVPTGAEIWINNIDQGVTTTGWFTLNPGTYTIMLTKPGYEDYIEIITLESNQNAIVQGNLILATGDLDISSTPSGAEIFLAPTGSPLVDQGILTPNTISLSPGTYDYKLTRIDYYDVTGSFTITSGLTTTINIPLTPLSCPIVPKYSGDTVTLNATPKDGIGPYYVEFRKNGVIIDPSRLGELDNPIINALENALITRVYTLDDLDISSALTGIIDFSTYMEDSCPTGYQTCTDTCTITIGCLAPVCNFTVT